MDTALHCNDLKCRATVTDRAVVTTCSHIFCLPCADRLDLSAPKDGQRKCPACGTFLLNLDDAVVASLNPTEDYKTSILSGLSPTVIMECAGRGLSFWAYQMAQEITYQEYMARSLTDRYNSLSAHVEAMTRDVQEESKQMGAKLEAVHAENADLAERYNTLEKKYKEKSNAERHYRELYQKIKAQAIGPRLASAADREVDEHIQRAGNTHQESPQGYTRDNGRRNPINGSNGSGENRNSQRQHSTLQNPPYGHSQSYGNQQVHSRAGLTTANSASQAPPTASQNRQHLPTPAFGQYNNTVLQHGPPHPVRGQTPLRGNTAASWPAGSPAPGMSANAKYGRPIGGQYSHAPMPGSRAGVIGAGRPGYAPAYMRG